MLKRLLKIFAILMALCALPLCAQAAQVLEGGAAGETVMVLTRRLVELGFMTEPVSEYNADVSSAVGDFQTANGLERTGIADINTQQAMYATNVVTRIEYMNGFATQYDGVTIAAGSSGDEVNMMQVRLLELGYYDFYVDGRFGEGTRRAVENYQRANGLESTGIADESFFIRLYFGESISYSEFVMQQCAEKGENGTDVHAIQVRLAELGYFRGEASGNYGDNTARAVSRFQYDNGITQTGNVDYETYEELFSANARHAEDDGSLFPGDTGDDVRAMQSQLRLLGFYFHEPDGVYGFCTETSVMLFRAANGLPISENADIEMLMALYSEDAVDSLSVVVTDGELTVEDVDTVCNYAFSCVGENFTDHGEMYPGLGFVRNVYAHVGVDIGAPNIAVMNIVDASYTDMESAPVAPLAFTHMRNGTEITSFGINVGSGNIVWANDITGMVEIVSVDTIELTGIYIWKVGK